MYFHNIASQKDKECIYPKWSKDTLFCIYAYIQFVICKLDPHAMLNHYACRKLHHCNSVKRNRAWRCTVCSINSVECIQRMSYTHTGERSVRSVDGSNELCRVNISLTHQSLCGRFSHVLQSVSRLVTYRVDYT